MSNIKAFKSAVKILPILGTDIYLLFRLHFINSLEFAKLIYSRRLIYLKSQLQNSLNVSDEIWIRKTELPQSSDLTVVSQRVARDALNQSAHQADLNSNHDVAQSNFKEAGQIAIDLLSGFGLNNIGFSFVGTEITKSIGHTAKCLSLRQKILDLHPEIEHKFLITSDNSPNRNFLSYWYKFFPRFDVNPYTELIVEKEMWPFYEAVSSVAIANSSIPLFEAHDRYSRSWETLQKEPLLELSQDDRKFGFEFLSQHGFETLGNGKFITIHVRNSNTWNNGRLISSSSGRNAEISTYQNTITFLLDLGYFVVRIGDRDQSSLNDNPRLIDYTKVNSQIDRLNTFFLAECEFLIGTNSGPICVPPAFGRRVLMTNAPSIAQTAYFTNSLMLPKLVYDNQDNILTLDEMIDCGAGWSDTTIRGTEPTNFRWRNNSPDEILDAVMELLEKPSIETSDLRETFERKIKRHGSVATANISVSFLKSWKSRLL